MQQQNAATEKCCTQRNDAEPKTHKHTKQMQQQNAANTENQNDTTPQKHM